MKRMRLVAFACSTVLILTMVVFSNQAVAKTFKWITFKPQGSGDAQTRSTQWFVDEFQKRTSGEHSIKVFWGGSVAKTGEIPEALGAGVGDFGDIITPYFPDKFLLNNAIGFFIPQPNSSIQIANLMEKWHATYPQFGQELAKNNLKAIGFRPLEDYGLLCKKPAKTLDDMKGLRVRTYGFAYPALVEALGATAVSMNTAETYEGLERGIIDCTPVGPALARGWKYDEVAKYYIEFPFGASFGHLIAMNLDTYNSLDAATRAIVDQLGKDYAVEYDRMLAADQEVTRSLWKNMGVKEVPFPRAGIDKIIADKKVQAVQKEWIERATALGIPGEKIAEELKF